MFIECDSGYKLLKEQDIFMLLELHTLGTELLVAAIHYVPPIFTMDQFNIGIIFTDWPSMCGK